MRGHRGFWLSVPLIAVLAASPAIGFSRPLSPEAIRDAYVLGTADATKRAEVFARYTRTFPTPAAGPSVASIQFQTPYIAVADQIAQKAANYHAPDAEEDFLGKPAVCRVLVQVYFPYNEYDNFTVQLTQAGKKVKSQFQHGTFLYTDEETPAAVGIQMDVEYAAETIDADEPAGIRVMIENGPTVRATFDLSQLR